MQQSRALQRFIAIAVLTVPVMAHGEALNSADALALITQTADRICSVVSTQGSSQSSEAKGQINAQLRGLTSRIIDAGGSANADVNRESYQNVLRQDLAGLINNNAACKERVFNSLINKLLPSNQSSPTQHNTSTSNSSTVTRPTRPANTQSSRQLVYSPPTLRSSEGGTLYVAGCAAQNSGGAFYACGREQADYFCKAAGHQGAKDYQVAYAEPTRQSYMFGSRIIVYGGAASGQPPHTFLSWVECEE